MSAGVRSLWRVEIWPHARPKRKKACDETPLDEAGIWKDHKISLGGLQDELERLLGVHVDVLTSDDLPLKLRTKILAQA